MEIFHESVSEYFFVLDDNTFDVSNICEVDPISTSNHVRNHRK